MPSRNHELSLAERDSTVRPGSVRLPARRAAECVLAFLRPRPGHGPRGQVRDRKCRLPHAPLEMLSAKQWRPAVHHLPQSARCSARSGSDAALRRSLPQVPRCRLRSDRGGGEAHRARPVAPIAICRNGAPRTSCTRPRPTTTSSGAGRRAICWRKWAERHETGDKAYRGEVVLYYPEKLPQRPTTISISPSPRWSRRAIWPAGSAGSTEAIERHAPARAEFYLGLAEAWRNSGQLDKALPLYREAVRRDPKSAFGLQKLGVRSETLRPGRRRPPTSCNGLPSCRAQRRHRPGTNWV